MKATEAMLQRRSIRKFTEEPVSDEVVWAILGHAGLAPSAGGLRAYHALAVDGETVTHWTGIASPVALVICALPAVSEAKYGERGRRLYAVQDATIFGAYVQLAAVEMGLASVWVGAFDERAVAAAFGLDAGCVPVAILHIGHAAEKKNPRQARRMSDHMDWRVSHA